MDVIFDIDGTLADASHRLHWIQDMANWVPANSNGVPRPNWEKFMDPEAVAQDLPITPVWEILYSLMNAGNRFIFITGRSEKLRKTTADWLTNQDCAIRRRLGTLLYREAIDIHIFMRKAKDRRPSDETKQDGLMEARAAGFDPKLVFEDRHQDTAMWRRNGLICAQVADGFY